MHESKGVFDFAFIGDRVVRMQPIQFYYHHATIFQKAETKYHDLHETRTVSLEFEQSSQKGTSSLFDYYLVYYGADKIRGKAHGNIVDDLGNEFEIRDAIAVKYDKYCNVI